MSRILIATSAAALLAACSPSTPTSPTPASMTTGAVYSLSGLIREITAEGLVPVAGATVLVLGGTTPSLSDQHGAYVIAGLPAMRSSVSVSRSGYATEAREITIAGDTQLNIDIARVSRFILTGTVLKVTPAGEMPFAGLQIYCDGCGEFGHTGVITDADGIYRFPWVYEGVHQLQLYTQDYIDPGAKPFAGITVSEVVVSSDTTFNLKLVPR